MSKKHKFHNLLWFLLGVIIIILLCIIVEWSKAHAFEQHDAMTIYTMTTDEPLTIAWDDTNTEIADYFDFYMWNFGEEKKYLIGKTQALQANMVLPRTGLWVFYCRACDKPETDTTRICSEYASSDKLEFAQVKDPATGLFVAGKWMIYGHVAAPTGGGVE